MANELSIIPKPVTVTEAMNMAKMIASSTFAPKGMANKPGDILLAWQLGAEIGLSLMQALQNIAVINGKPTIYGDAALAVVQAHPHYVNHREWFEGDIKAGTRTAYCAITRRGSPEHITGFSMDDAKKASLWGKQGPWSLYPDRMLQMRARGFAIRDKFADALKGIITREEVEDYEQVSEVTAQKTIVKVMPVSETIGIAGHTELAFDFSRIESCETLAELKALYSELKEQCQNYPEHYKILNNLTNDHKKYLEDKESVTNESAEQSDPLPAAGELSAAS